MTRPPFLLIGGGARSGKSAYALDRALKWGSQRIFLATAEDRDPEMHERITRHQQERGQLFMTVEEPRSLAAALELYGSSDGILVDCLTLWISNLMWDAQGNETQPEQIEEQIEDLCGAIRLRRCPIILVSNEVGLGTVPSHASARAFRDYTGRAHQLLAQEADEVFLALFGCVLRIKPSLDLAHPIPTTQE